MGTRGRRPGMATAMGCAAMLGLPIALAASAARTTSWTSSAAAPAPVPPPPPPPYPSPLSSLLSPVSFFTPAQEPLPDARTFLDLARDNLARSQREQDRYAYRERRTDVHTNPFGRLGTGGTRTFDVQPGPEPGILFRKLLERDGVPVTDAPAERVDRRGRPERRNSIRDVAAALDFTLERREIVDGTPVIRVTFAPSPDAKPQTREGRMAKAFRGTIWIDEHAHEVTRIQATAIDDLSYGFGIVARLNEGTTIRLERQRIDDSIWLPTSIRVVGQGRAMLFRKLTIDFAIDWFDYRRASG